jgi:hypothetical protein
MTKRRERQPEGPAAIGYAGVIRRDAVYRVDELKERMGWRDAAFRAARRRGLKVHHVGKRTYITGEDLFAYITTGGSHE